jgi:hypothetical protein
VWVHSTPDGILYTIYEIGSSAAGKRQDDPK